MIAVLLCGCGEKTESASAVDSPAVAAATGAQEVEPEITQGRMLNYIKSSAGWEGIISDLRDRLADEKGAGAAALLLEDLRTAEKELEKEKEKYAPAVKAFDDLYMPSPVVATSHENIRVYEAMSEYRMMLARLNKRKQSGDQEAEKEFQTLMEWELEKVLAISVEQ